MEISDIKIRRLNEEGKMKAVVSVTFDNEFVVHDIKVIDGSDKLFIAMPSRKINDGEFKDIVHPINKDMREKISAAVIKEYNDALVNGIEQ